MKQASKSQKRVEFLEVLAKALSSEEVFEHIDYESMAHHQCKKFFKERSKSEITIWTDKYYNYKRKKYKK